MVKVMNLQRTSETTCGFKGQLPAKGGTSLNKTSSKYNLGLTQPGISLLWNAHHSHTGICCDTPTAERLCRKDGSSTVELSIYYSAAVSLFGLVPRSETLLLFGPGSEASPLYYTSLIQYAQLPLLCSK